MGGYGKRFRSTGTSGGSGRRKRFVTPTVSNFSFNAMRFNGGTGGFYFSCFYNSDLNWNGKTKFSVSAWIKHDNTIDTYINNVYVSQHKQTGTRESVWRLWQRNTTQIGLSIANHVNDALTAAGLFNNSGVTLNVFNNYIFTLDADGAGNSDKMRCYLNGVSSSLIYLNSAPLATTMSIGQADFCIGAMGSAGGGSWFGPGEMDDCAVWEECLSQSQITTIYNGGVPIDLTLLSNAYNLRYYFRLGENMIGSGLDGLFVKNEVSGTNGLIKNLTGSFDSPIVVRSAV